MLELERGKIEGDGETVRWSLVHSSVSRRYTGYAYRLPEWICETTHRDNVDWRADRTKWRRELLGFCDGFDFLGLEVIEESKGEAENEYFIEFLARLRTRKQVWPSTSTQFRNCRTLPTAR